ncbi:type II toxin-antitoxin system VapC family toxin [Azospirillum sp. sgz301742]
MNWAGPILLDTCAMIYIATKQPISMPAREAVLAAAQGPGVLLSPVSAWEIGLLSAKKVAMEFLPDPKAWFNRFLMRPGTRLTLFTTDIAIDAAYLPLPLHGDPADRMLIATARSLSVPILTSDRKILAYADAGHVQAIAC